MTKVKELQNENNKLEEEMGKNYKQAYTDMIVYLRGASINSYHQEMIRNDLLNLVLEGQARNASIDEIFGFDKQAFMDEVIAAAPKMSSKEKGLERLSLFILLFCILTSIHLASDFIMYWINKFFLHQSEYRLPVVHIGIMDIVGAVLISYYSIKFLDMIINNTYQSSIKEERRQVIFYGLVGIIMLMSIVLGSHYDVNLVNIPFVIYIFIIGLIFLTYKMIEGHVSKTYHTEL